MNFTQYMFPDGKRRPSSIETTPEVEQLASELVKAGWQFEIECHPDTQLIHMDCCDEDRPLTSEVVPNGPQVPIAVQKLVRDAHAIWLAEGKPEACR